MTGRNITLIGMPGSGKSYIGKKLAEQLGYELVELDAVMEQEFGRPLQEILDTLGDETFLEKQAEDAIMHTTGKERLVVSPGGSIVYTEDAMRHLREVSLVICLKIDFEIVRERIAEVPRGIVGLGNKTLKELYEERTLLYEKWSEVTVDAVQKSEKVVQDIVAHI